MASAWKGSTGSYGDGKSYAANSDDTLSAQWSNQRFNYNVEYYYMSLAYYYTRNSYNINAVSKVSDGGSESGATITGTGSYLYRNDAALRAVVPDGYTFKGWYKAEDVLEGYDASDNTKTLDSYKLKADISGVSKVSEAVSYTVKVDDTSNYVAVVDPVVPSAQDNTITISGGNSYKYGYAKSDVTALNANVTTGTYDFVSSYQWYEGDTAIEGATTSAYLIPTGKASGSYNYKCRAVVENKYSGRKIEITSEPYPVTVGTADITCHAGIVGQSYRIQGCNGHNG